MLFGWITMANKFFFSLALSLIWLLLKTSPALAATPLEQAGYTPVWAENFNNMTIPNMQWSFAYSQSGSKVDNFVIPGAIHLGQTYAAAWGTETQINHFKMSNNEPQTKTVEFDMFLTKPASSRIFVRAHRNEAGVFIYLNQSNSTKVEFYDLNGSTHIWIPWNTFVGANKWAHVVVSLSQDWTNKRVEAVVAINNEVKQRTMGSFKLGSLSNYWAQNGEVWSFEFNGGGSNTGYYLSNFRGYESFIDKATLETKLGNVNSYLSTLPAPNRNTSKDITRSQTGKIVAIADLHSQNGYTTTLNGSFSQAWKQITKYEWNFGDGTSGTGKLVSHTYPSVNKTYDVVLKVTSSEGSSTDTIKVTVPGTIGLPISTPTPTPQSSPPTNGKPGDANGDGKVDGIDYTIWLNHYNQSTTGPSNGDFNNSGKVDGIDYTIWLTNYGK